MSWYHAPIAASVDDLAPPGKSVAAQGLVIFTMHMLGTAPASWVIGEISQRSTLHLAMWVPTVGARRRRARDDGRDRELRRRSRARARLAAPA